MKFSEACGLIYTDEIAKDVDMEKVDEKYMHQNAFRNCMARGKALGLAAEQRVDRFKALAILLHRKEYHNETFDQEETELMAAMPEEDIKLAVDGVSVYSWWKA